MKIIEIVEHIKSDLFRYTGKVTFTSFLKEFFIIMVLFIHFGLGYQNVNIHMLDTLHSFF